MFLKLFFLSDLLTYKNVKYKKSFVWDNFTKITNHPNIVRCNLCTSVLTLKGGTTSNIMRHFRLKHSTLNLADTQRVFIYLCLTKVIVCYFTYVVFCSILINIRLF